MWKPSSFLRPLPSALFLGALLGLTLGLSSLAFMGCSLIVDTDPFLPGGGNGPSTPMIHIEPTSPSSADDLTVVFDRESTDPQGRAITYEYQWLRDGEEIAELTTDTVPSSQTAGDQTWTVYVHPVTEDGRRGGAGTDAVTIGGGPPVVGYVGLSTYRPISGERLAAFVGPVIDPDGEATSLSYRWYRDGALIDGETSSSLMLTAFPGGTRVRVEVVATDAGGADSEPVSAGDALVWSDVIRWRQLLPERGAEDVLNVFPDPPNQRVILMNTKIDSGAVSIDIWEYTLKEGEERFIQLFPTGPRPRGFQGAAAYDSRNRRVILFGGFDPEASGVSNSVWSLDLSRRGSEQWIELSPSGMLPSARYLATMAYDEERERMILVSGISGEGNPEPDYSFLDVSNPGFEAWSGARPLVEPVVGPAVLIDPTNDRAIFAGGIDTSGSDPVSVTSIYTLDLNDPRAALQPASSSLPTGVAVAAAYFDEERNRGLLAFGITAGDEPSTEVYSIDLGTLAVSTVALSGEAPTDGGAGFLIRDPYNGRVIAWPGYNFSGRDDPGFDLFAFDPANDAFTSLFRHGVTMPIGLSRAQASYNGGLRILGGLGETDLAHPEMWDLSLDPGNRASWELVEQLPDAVSGMLPPPRAACIQQTNSVYGNEIHLFGGSVDGSTMGDGRTWTIDRENRWVERTLAAGEVAPMPRIGAAFFDPACGASEVGMVGGVTSSGLFFSDTNFLVCPIGDRLRECHWEDPVETLASPGLRAWATAARSPSSDVVLYGGQAGRITVYSDIRTLNPCGGGPQPWRTPSVSGTPVPRWGHSMSFIRDDTPGALDFFLVFGGAEDYDGNDIRNEVFQILRLASENYSFDAVDVASGPEDAMIPPRIFHVAVFDERENRLLVYGGRARVFDRSSYSDLWELHLPPR